MQGFPGVLRSSLQEDLRKHRAAAGWDAAQDEAVSNTYQA